MLAVHASRARTCPSGRGWSPPRCGRVWTKNRADIRDGTLASYVRARTERPARSMGMGDHSGERSRPSRQTSKRSRSAAWSARWLRRRVRRSWQGSVGQRAHRCIREDLPQAVPTSPTTPPRGRARARQRPRRKALRGRRLRKLGEAALQAPSPSGMVRAGAPETASSPTWSTIPLPLQFALRALHPLRRRAVFAAG